MKFVKGALLLAPALFCSCQEAPVAAGASADSPAPAAPVIIDPWKKEVSAEQVDNERAMVEKIISSAHPVKIYFRSEPGPDDGSWSWVIGRYDGPRRFLGTVSPAIFHELLSAPEYGGGGNDAWVNIEALTEEGVCYTFSIYMETDRADTDLTYIDSTARSVNAPKFWQAIAELIERKYHIFARYGGH